MLYFRTKEKSWWNLYFKDRSQAMKRLPLSVAPVIPAICIMCISPPRPDPIPKTRVGICICILASLVLSFKFKGPDLAILVFYVFTCKIKYLLFYNPNKIF